MRMKQKLIFQIGWLKNTEIFKTTKSQHLFTKSSVIGPWVSNVWCIKFSSKHSTAVYRGTSVFIEKINASDKAQNQPKNTKMQLLPVFELTSNPRTHTKNFRKIFLRIGSFEFLVAKSFFLLHSYENQPKYILPSLYYKNRTRSAYAIIMTLTIWLEHCSMSWNLTGFLFCFFLVIMPYSFCCIRTFT